MKKNDIYILGAGGMAREVFALYSDMNLIKRVKGFIVQENKSTIKKLFDMPVYSDKILEKIHNCLLIGAIGNPLREKWIKTISKKNHQFDTLIHPSAHIGKNISIGQGSVIMQNTVLTSDITIGEHTTINLAATLSHDTQIGSFCSISPGVHIGGNVSIKDRTFIGIGTVIKQKVVIGKSSYIGAGSVVVSNIPDNSLAYGNPARVVRNIDKKDWEKLL